MGKFGETYDRLVNELAIAPVVAPALPAIKAAGSAAVVRGLAALGGGLATLMSNKTKTTTKTKTKKPDTELTTTTSKTLPGVEGPVVQSKFNECYDRIAKSIMSEALPLVLAAPALAPIIKGAIGTAATIGAGKLAYDASKSLSQAQTTPGTKPFLPTSTSTPAISQPVTTTTTPPTVATPTSTTTPPLVASPGKTITPADTDVAGTGTVSPGAIAGTGVLPLAMSKTQALSRSIARTQTRTKRQQPDFDLIPTSSKALPGVEGPIIQDKFLIP